MLNGKISGPSQSPNSDLPVTNPAVGEGLSLPTFDYAAPTAPPPSMTATAGEKKWCNDMRIGLTTMTLTPIETSREQKASR